MLILGIDLVVPGNEVNYKIGNPTNPEAKPEQTTTNGSANGNINKPNSSTAGYQSKYTVIIAFRINVYI